VTSTERTWPSIWSPPARKKALTAHPVCARREHRIIRSWLKADRALGSSTLANLFSHLFHISTWG
jgi:hypothetical protein